MKLSTQKIFKTLKNTPKRKPKLSQKPKLSSQHLTINKVSKLGNNPKSKIFLNTVSESENPFTEPKTRTSQIRRKTSKNILLKNQKIEINLFKTEDDLFQDEDSYINNVLLTSESDSNKYENNAEVEIRELKKDAQKKDIDSLCKMFQKSDLKSTIIIDNQGNNNLNKEQKEIIGNYFNFNKNKCINSINKIKINSIPSQKYKENKTLFIEKSPLIISSKCKGTVYKFNNNLKNSKENKKAKLIIHKKILSTKEAINKKNKLGELLGLKIDNKQKCDIDNNSIFENCTNKSIDSSFLGSSLDDDFYQDLTEQK
jgi:hypothetical protein